MSGSYGPTLVAASYGVAVVAAYTALYFGTRLFDVSGRTRRGWLIVGGICMGSGIWSMHFVGMSAYTMPGHMEMSFNLWLTLASWVPAVAASLLALYIIARKSVSVGGIVASALAMGTGICAMHYTGMEAMLMTPQISYKPLLFAVSVLIAITASGAALIICRQVRQVPIKFAAWYKLGAALVMGIAICGMHYTGMMAAVYAPDATMPATNLLRGAWMGIPVAMVTAVLLLSALWLAVGDFRRIEAEKIAARKRERWIENAVHTDMATGFHNRQHFQQLLAKRMAATDSHERFSLLGLTMEGYRQLAADQSEITANKLAKHAANALRTHTPEGSTFARIGRTHFVVLTQHLSDATVKKLASTIHHALTNQPFGDRYGHWSLGVSHYPATSKHSQTLIKLAIKPVHNSATA